MLREYQRHLGIRFDGIAIQIEAVIYDNRNETIDQYGNRRGRGYNSATITAFQDAVRLLRFMQVYVNRIDWLVNYDGSEENFHKKLQQSLGAEDLRGIAFERNIERKIQTTTLPSNRREHMSGGHFDYQQYRLEDIASEIESLICSNNDDSVNEYGERVGRGYSHATIREFQTAARWLRKAFVYAERIDLLVSGDEDEDAFHHRLKEDLEQMASRARAVPSEAE